MPTLIRREADGAFREAADPFLFVPDGDESETAAKPPEQDVIVTLDRFLSEGAVLEGEGRRVGVRLPSDVDAERIADALPRLPVVAVEFPKFRDGRAFTTARVLRERYGYRGEVRAVGEVLREQAGFMVRCGFDAFEVSDGASSQEWAAAANRFRHVYQHAADTRPTAAEERGTAHG